MSGRKIDYFGTFIESMKRKAAPATDPANEVLKALRAGDRPAQDLMACVGNSASAFITVSEQLTKVGWVKRNGEMFTLTDEGRKIAAVLV